MEEVPLTMTKGGEQGVCVCDRDYTHFLLLHPFIHLKMQRLISTLARRARVAGNICPGFRSFSAQLSSVRTLPGGRRRKGKRSPSSLPGSSSTPSVYCETLTKAAFSFPNPLASLFSSYPIPTLSFSPTVFKHPTRSTAPMTPTTPRTSPLTSPLRTTRWSK